MKLGISLLVLAVVSQCQAYVWVQSSNVKGLPPNCADSGTANNGPLYAIRKQYGNEMVIGILVASSSYTMGYFPVQGNEQKSDTYEVLCGGTKTWDYSRQLDRDMHVAGGKSATGEIYYVCQVDSDDGKRPGTYKDSIKSCCIPLWDKERCYKDKFGLLVNDC